MMECNEVLIKLNIKITKVILDWKASSLSLSPENVELEFSKISNKNGKTNNETVSQWYQQFITAKEKEINAGINSYRSTHEHFKSFAEGKGVIHLQDLTKQLLEDFRSYLILALGNISRSLFSRSRSSSAVKEQCKYME